MIPYLEGSYPWAYAHHYLRMERESLPAPVRFGEEPMSLDDAVRVVGWGCGITGEAIHPAAPALADAYLQRWGIQRAAAPALPASQALEPDEASEPPVMTK